MLALSVVLLSLVYLHPMPDKQSSYSKGNAINLPLDPAYYVNYSATRLGFVASVSSTLSTILIGAAMFLFSYPTAYFIAINSDKDETSKSPSPYQPELLIKMLDARMAVACSFFLYGLGAKSTRFLIVSIIRRTLAMLGILMLSAYLTPHPKSWSVV